MAERHVDDVLDAYALGALEPAEVDEVERHLEYCAACTSRAANARAVADLLLSAVPQVAPPPSLRAKLMERIAREREAARGASTGTSGPLASTPAAEAPIEAPSRQPRTLGQMLRSIFGGETPDDEQAHAGEVLRALLAEPDTVVWSVGGTDAAPGAAARLVGSRTRREAVLVTTGLHQPARDQVYQIWFLSGGAPVPNALFGVDRAGRGARVVRTDAPLSAYDTVAVTLEPAGGRPGPTGPIVLAGQLV